MSNQAKFLISLLFIAIIILCAGLTRFYFDVTKNTGYTNDGEEIDALVKTYGNGMQVFASAGGYYGLLDAEGTVVIEPEWMEILTVTENMALVSRKIQDEVLIGGIDFEENVVLPFVFRSMQQIHDTYYIGTAAEDESCIIYNMDFEPVFQNSWDSAEYDNGMLLLEKDGCLFAYYIAEEEPIFRKAQMSCMVGEHELEWNIANRIYLSELSPDDLLRINHCVTSYIEMLLHNDFSQLTSISASEYSNGLSKMNCFAGFTFEDVTDFSFSSADREKQIYDFAFTIEYDAPLPEQEASTDGTDETAALAGEVEQSVQVCLSLQRSASNRMILTSVDLDYHSVQTPVQEPAI